MNVSEVQVDDIPIHMRFNDGHRLSITVYSVLMVFSAIGNLTVLVLVFKRRRKTPSRINTMLMHLAIADLLVTFLMMPLEIGWAATVSWWAGDAMCRIMAFFRVFGLFLSSNILVCISIDRYYAVLKPLRLTGIDKGGKYLLTTAWIGATVCSAPQTLIFHVEAHPNYTWYEQCITFNVLPSYAHEVSYSVFGMLMMYAFPLTIIIFSYVSILKEISRRSREPIGASSSLGSLGRAKIRTLKMTIIIVVVFFVCWTPYYVISVWYWCDRESAMRVDERVQKGLFLFACTNSCMNPIVYGAFNIRARRGVPQKTPNDLEVRFLDFQQQRLESPAFDFLYFFLVQASGDVLRNFDEYVLIYYSSFNEFLRELGSNPDELFTLEDFYAHHYAETIFHKNNASYTHN